MQCTVAIAPFFVFAGYNVCKTAITSFTGPFPTPPALGFEKPVISNLENKNYYESAKNFTYFAECPIVSSNPKNLKSQLKILIESPELRKQIGEKGRSYVKKYHSSEGQGLLWSKIINFINGEIEEGLDDWWKERA